MVYFWNEYVYFCTSLVIKAYFCSKLMDILIQLRVIFHLFLKIQQRYERK